MSVRPVAFAADGGVTVVHDEAGHGGDVAFASIRFGRKLDGTPDPDWLELPCPACSAVSFHPIGGGASPGAVQKLFARLYLRRAAALGIPVAQRDWAGIKARLRARVEATEGPGRFRLAAMQSEDDEPEP
ncbi:MAG TPA: hypothetical protein VG370_34960 [Chloroflexota bacterium]|jgi:hypothetical protein|nr:hypothetical protein [Chloroflexota bacterium]